MHRRSRKHIIPCTDIQCWLFLIQMHGCSEYPASLQSGITQIKPAFYTSCFPACPKHFPEIISIARFVSVGTVRVISCTVLSAVGIGCACGDICFHTRKEQANLAPCGTCTILRCCLRSLSSGDTCCRVWCCHWRWDCVSLWYHPVQHEE